MNFYNKTLNITEDAIFEEETYSLRFNSNHIFVVNKEIVDTLEDEGFSIFMETRKDGKRLFIEKNDQKISLSRYIMKAINKDTIKFKNNNKYIYAKSNLERKIFGPKTQVALLTLTNEYVLLDRATHSLQTLHTNFDRITLTNINNFILLFYKKYYGFKIISFEYSNRVCNFLIELSDGSCLLEFIEANIDIKDIIIIRNALNS